MNGDSNRNRADTCPDAETLAAWADGGLDHQAAMMAEAHMAACDRCQATLKAMSIAVMPAAKDTAPARAWWKIAWLVPVTAVAAAVALYVATPDQQSIAPSLPAARQAENVPQPAPEQQPQAFALPKAVPEAAKPAAPAPELRMERDTAPPPAVDTTRADAGARNQLEEKREVEAARAGEADRSALAAAAPPPRARVLGESAAPVPTREAVLGGGLIWRLPAASPGAVERSIDGGQTWEKIPFPEAIELVTIRATDGQNATVTSADGRVFRTTDGGKTWLRP